MDVLAHSLWTNVMYEMIPQTKSQKKMTRWGIFFGVFPDIVAFTPIWVYVFYDWIFRGHLFKFARPEDGGAFPLENLTSHLYQFSHSLVIWAVVVIITWIIIRKFPLVLLGWALHIGID